MSGILSTQIPPCLVRVCTPIKNTFITYVRWRRRSYRERIDAPIMNVSITYVR